MRVLRRWWWSLGLWPRAALVLSAGVLALFGTFTALGEWALEGSSQRIKEERLVIAQMVARQVDGVLRRALFELDQAQRLADFDPAIPDRTDEARTLAQTYVQSNIFAAILFLDAQERVVLAHPSDDYPPGTDLSHNPHITRAVQSHPGGVSEPFLDQGGRPVTAVTVPLPGADGKLRGMLVGLVAMDGPEIMSPLQQAVRSGNTGHAVLVDAQGRVIQSTFALPFLSPGEHARFYRSVLAAHNAVVATVPFELNVQGEPMGHMHVMAIAPVEDAPWGVAVGGDEAETFAAVQRLRSGLALLGLIVLIAIWGITLLVTRWLVRPVQRLMQAARRIAAGDLQVPLEAAEGGEIGEMADALEQMRRSLLHNIQELARLSETLETRVKERTEALRRQEALAHRLLRRALAAQEEERRRISYELHDEIGQSLTALRLDLERLARSSTDRAAKERIAQAQEMVGRVVADLRRVIAALHPGVLDQLGLIPALQWVAERTLRPLGVEVAIQGQTEPRLPAETELVLFRVAQEAIHNIARHSGASRVEVTLQRESGSIVMIVHDNGRGFDPTAVVPDPDSGRGLGLAGMQERASLVGGHVRILSAPGEGATVEVHIPLSPAVETQTLPPSAESGSGSA